MREWQSQSHVRWYCRYHVVWVPKYRKRAIFGEMRRGIGRIVRELCQRQGVELVEGHALSDHVYVLLGIPPKFSVANTVGFLKGKSAIRIHREYLGRQRNFTVTTSGRAGTASARSVWPKRSSATTSGSRKQRKRNKRSWNSANRRPLRGAFIIPPPQGAVADLTSLGEVRPESRVDLVRSSIGMAVRSGTPRPDITSKEAFIATLLAAESIGYSASASGTYLSTVVFPRLGIWEQIKDKSQRVVSERVATTVARGDVQIGFQQISEILPIEGADYVGPIPDEVQKITTFSTGIAERALNPEDARRLIDYLLSEDVAQTIAITGLSPVVSEGRASSSESGP